MCAVYKIGIILKLTIPLTTVDDDLRYEDDSWQDQTHNQDDQREVEMFHSQDFKFFLLFFFFESNFVDHQTSLDLKRSNFMILWDI